MKIVILDCTGLTSEKEESNSFQRTIELDMI